MELWKKLLITYLFGGVAILISILFINSIDFNISFLAIPFLYPIVGIMSALLIKESVRNIITTQIYTIGTILSLIGMLVVALIHIKNK